jgi:cysteine-rich repeat protein
MRLSSRAALFALFAALGQTGCLPGSDNGTPDAGLGAGGGAATGQGGSTASAGGDGGLGGGGSTASAGGDGGSGGSGGGPACGDGVVDEGEACDDGDTESGDGCSAACAIEAGFACEGEPSACAAICGDGLVRGAETCDDGDTDDADGCSATCTAEPGFVCTGEPSVCEFTCGDGALDPGEECDDGDLDPADGCGATCVVESGYACFGQPSVCAPVCGDGLIRGAEKCDDGDVGGGDGCGPACAIEVGFTCTGEPSLCKPVCGDGLLKAGEACDDKNGASGDGCSSACAIEAGFTCAGTPSVCHTTCGDLIVAGDETCDDGNTSDADCCSSSCQAQPSCELESNDTAATANNYAAIATLGQVNAFIEPAGDHDVFVMHVEEGTVGSLEARVVGGAAGSTCDSKLVDTWMALRDANGAQIAQNEDDGRGFCSSLRTGALAPGDYYLTVQASSYAPTATFDYGVALTQGVCNNGVVEPGEECDDGTSAAGDGCDDECRYSPYFEVESNNNAGAANGPWALPFVVRGTNDNFGDTDFFAIDLPTTADLRVSAFDHRGPGSCDAGGGNDLAFVLLASDGTTVLASDDDSGPSVCALLDPAIQPGVRHLPPGRYYVMEAVGGSNAFIPNTSYGVLVEYAAECGNLLVEGFEECDGGPGCDASCDRVPQCGDGFLDAPEECDDGGTVSSDGCSATCKLEGGLLEQEPNGTTAEADQRALDAFPLKLTQDVFLRGAIGSTIDVDHYRLDLTAAGTVSIEERDATGSGCSGAADVSLAILSGAGATLASDTAGGQGSCAAVTVALSAGSHYVRVASLGAGAATGAYSLLASFRADGVAEGEPNDTFATARALGAGDVVVKGNHSVGTDVDVFSVVVPAGASLRAEVVEGGAETCESLGVDAQVSLYDAAGKRLATDDDSGRGFCARLDGTGDSPKDAGASRLSAGTYYVVVEASVAAAGDADGQFDYRLFVSARTPVCALCATVTTCQSAAQCQSGVCLGGYCQPPTCSDGVKNGSESAIDCGGVDCGRCLAGQACLFDTDCINDVCSGGLC